MTRWTATSYSTAYLHPVVLIPRKPYQYLVMGDAATGLIRAASYVGHRQCGRGREPANRPCDGTDCHSAWGLDADRPHKLLIPNGTSGSMFAPNNTLEFLNPSPGRSPRRAGRQGGAASRPDRGGFRGRQGSAVRARLSPARSGHRAFRPQGDRRLDGSTLRLDFKSRRAGCFNSRQGAVGGDAGWKGGLVR